MSKQLYESNKAIADFVRKKQASSLPYTQEEIAYINTYVGYGGMWKFSDELSKERGLYEYYTPIEIVAKMVGLVHKHTQGSIYPVLEPSCGIGRFLHYFDPNKEVDAIEIDEVSYLIASANFPNYKITHQSFNSLFVDRRGKSKDFKAKYKTIIGNPPYGAFAGKLTSREKQLTKASTYVDYFITRGLDLLLKDGLLVYIIPSAFIDGRQTEVKDRIMKKADLVDAYRLPKRMFDQTDIQTDIVVFKKI